MGMLGREHARWLADGGLKLINEFEGADFGPDSIVFDIGGYIGGWSGNIKQKYDSQLYIFEPVKVFYDTICKKLGSSPKVHIFCSGLGAYSRQETIKECGDGSSIFLEKGTPLCIQIRSIAEVMNELNIPIVNLTSINIEGGEYELVNAIIKEGLIHKFEHLLIQFHEIGSFTLHQRERIREQLRVTHEPVYIYDTVWDYWVKR